MGDVVVVDAMSGKEIFRIDGGSVSAFAWNHENELMISGYGKFVFDWESVGSNKKESTNSKLNQMRSRLRK